MNAWFSDKALMNASAARRHALAWRAGCTFAYAISIGLATNSIGLPCSLYFLVLLFMLADAWAGLMYSHADRRDRPFFRAMFVASSVVTIAAYMGMALSAAAAAGAEGRLIAIFMATGSLVTTMILLVEAPIFMALCTLPGALCLIAVPMLPQTETHAPLASAGLYLALATLVAQLIRTGMQHASLFAHLTSAKEEADTRRKEAEQGRADAEQHRLEAERANKLKGEFLSTVTHELRTPLNAVINYSEMIAEETNGVVAQDANRITRSARHLLVLIERILDFATLTSGDVDLAPTSVDAGALVREVVSVHAPLLHRQNNAVAIDGDVVIQADADRLRQCLDCLISNAAKFTRDGRVEIVLAERGAEAVISVRDTGCGMSAESLASVFDAFVQSGDRAYGADGLGLGLAAARHMARLMGGDIIATSTPGLGSCFELMLPLAVGDAVLDQAAA